MSAKCILYTQHHIFYTPIHIYLGNDDIISLSFEDPLYGKHSLFPVGFHVICNKGQWDNMVMEKKRASYQEILQLKGRGDKV